MAFRRKVEKIGLDFPTIMQILLRIGCYVTIYLGLSTHGSSNWSSWRSCRNTCGTRSTGLWGELNAVFFFLFLIYTYQVPIFRTCHAESDKFSNFFKSTITHDTAPEQIKKHEQIISQKYYRNIMALFCNPVILMSKLL